MPDWFKRKIIYFPFLLLFLISIVLAQPPFEPQIAAGTDILEIRVPLVDYVAENQEGVTLHTHVFNKTSGLPLYPSATEIGCHLHLYNLTGQHTLESDMTADSNGEEWEINISSEQFSLGSHSYLIWCNNSAIGGFVSGGFKVTESGEVDTSEDWEDELLIYFVFALSIILLIFGFWKQDQNLAAISGILMIMLGIYITVNGFSAVNNILSLALGIIFICVGAYIFIRTEMENF